MASGEQDVEVRDERVAVIVTGESDGERCSEREVVHLYLQDVHRLRNKGEQQQR